MTLRITEAQLRAIELHAEAHYPDEAAGLILGEERDVLRTARQVLPLANRKSSGERGHRYELDPLDTLAAEDRADSLGLRIIGVFHSHPDHPAAPSQTDRQFAVPWYSYLITSVRGGRAGETRAWRMEEAEGSVEEEALELLADVDEPAGGPRTHGEAGEEEQAP